MIWRQHQIETPREYRHRSRHETNDARRAGKKV